MKETGGEQSALRQYRPWRLSSRGAAGHVLRWYETWPLPVPLDRYRGVLSSHWKPPGAVHPSACLFINQEIEIDRLTKVAHNTRLVCYAIPRCLGPAHPDTNAHSVCLSG